RMTSTEILEESGTAGLLVAALLNRYLGSLDDEELDDASAAAPLTPDTVVAFPPMSRHEGTEGMAGFHRKALSSFAATQHLGSPAVVVLDGDRAALRANLTAARVHHPRHVPPQGVLAPLFTTGTFVDGEALRTPVGWRLALLSFPLLWANAPP